MSKKEELYLKEERYISEQYVRITGWVIFFGKLTGVFCFHYLSSFFFTKIKMTSTDFHVEAIDRLCFVCGSIIMKNGHHVLAVLKEAMSLTFERSINLLENVTSSNICHSCWTQRCPRFSGVRYSEVSAIQRCPLFRGVAIQMCRYSEVSAIQRCPLFRGFHIRFCTNSCRSKKMCPLFGGARLLASPLLGDFTVYTSEVSIELQTSVVETINTCLKCSHMYSD